MDVERQRRQNQTDLSYDAFQDSLIERTHDFAAAVSLILLLIVNIIMLVVGCLKKNECPVQELIPIYLIVAGAVGIISKLLPFLNRKIKTDLLTFTIFLLFVFEFVWMVLGSYWVYSVHKINFNENQKEYCNKTAYLLAFWLLTVNWIILAIAVLFSCCALAVASRTK